MKLATVFVGSMSRMHARQFESAESILFSYRGIRIPRQDSMMNATEAKILRQFRSYGLRTNEMLFFNKSVTKPHLPEFVRAIKSLIEQGLIVQERHEDAYSLTDRGLEASLSA